MCVFKLAGDRKLKLQVRETVGRGVRREEERGLCDTEKRVVERQSERKRGRFSEGMSYRI